VGIICKLIGKAHGTDGCFDLEEARSITTTAIGIQTIESRGVRVDNNSVHYGSLAIGEHAEFIISEPYGSLEIV
jgi:hypothetical protein